MFETYALGALIALLISILTTPVGVSGAVFLVPAQISILNTPNPSVTPTNLLFNCIALPPAILRFRNTHRDSYRFGIELAGYAAPGAILGAIMRVEWLSGATAFYGLIALILVPIGSWLIVSSPTPSDVRPDVSRTLKPRVMFAISFGVGVIGGVYGIGGGSILAPILIALGLAIDRAASASLAVTLVTSVVGVITFTLLSLQSSENVAPDWMLGLFLGIGGLIGAQIGLSVRPHVSEVLLRRTLGVLALVAGLRYAGLVIFR